MRWLLVAGLLVLLIGCSNGADPGRRVTPSAASSTPAPNSQATETRTAELAELATAQAMLAQPTNAAATPTKLPAAPTATQVPAPPTNTPVPPTTTPAPPTDYAVGDKVEFESGMTAQVFQLERPFTSDNQFSQPGQGNEFVAVEAETCAGPNVPAGTVVSLNPFDYEITLEDNTRLSVTFSSGKVPAYQLIDAQAGDCVRGWVTFEVPVGAVIKFVNYSGHTYDYKQTIAKWTVSA